VRPESDLPSFWVEMTRLDLINDIDIETSSMIWKQKDGSNR
jgi:hypothetical protein